MRHNIIKNAKKWYTQQSTQQNTHFGFKKVPKSDKESLVGSVFSSVAPSYDIMNDAMSFGIHRLWKNHFINVLNPCSDMQLLDVAGGTGDIAFRFLEKTNQRAFVTVLDINAEMLKVGEERSKKLGLTSENIRFVQGNAENLSDIPSDSMDAYTIAFGIRNCTNIDKVLDEAYRVLKHGGRFLCLEFSHVQTPLVKQLYDFYSFQVIPKMGQAIAKDEESYQYLVESIRNFPKQEEFAQMISKSGFQHVSFENLNFGISAIHTGFKINK